MSLLARPCSTIAAGLTLVAVHGCICEPSVDRLDELEVDADLRAVVRVDDHSEDEDRMYTDLAVADGGKVVAWGLDFAGETGFFAETFELGDVELRGVWADGLLWWVVGENGFAAFSEDRGQTWTHLELETTAHLRTIISIGSQLVIAGDDMVLAQELDGSWSEPTPPSGGWGQLRAIAWNGSRTWVVGLDGVIRSTIDPRKEWIAEQSGVDNDLFAIERWSEARMIAVGTDGTLLRRDGDGWSRVKTHKRVNLVDFAHGFALGSGGEVFEVNDRGKLSLVETVSGARALGENWMGLTIVGEDGLVAAIPDSICFE